MLKKEVLKALIDVDSNAEELAISMGISKTSLYRFLNGQIKDYQKYVKPLHQFFCRTRIAKRFSSRNMGYHQSSLFRRSH